MITCDFCSKRALGVYAHGGAPVSFGVCAEHFFLLGCGPDTIQRANRWQAEGCSYTEADHQRVKEQQHKDQLQSNKEFDEKVKELNPQPVIVVTDQEHSTTYNSYL